MKKIQLNKPPRFLTHHLLLRPDCLVRMELPAYLTQMEANRVSAFLDALVIEPDIDGVNWPYDIDPDGDLNAQEIEDEFPFDSDVDEDDEPDERDLPLAPSKLDDLV